MVYTGKKSFISSFFSAFVGVELNFPNHVPYEKSSYHAYPQLQNN